ncbi:MAG: threonine synthase, partial [Clostridium tyrobutyricum]|nr:threonine synthase [Clostridium tyrobutyricum]
KYNWFDAATLKEPYRIEGKKTMGIEIVEYFNWEIPDAILYPTGGGVGIIGIFKALKELRKLGWIGEKLPKLISVQSEGCNPIVEAFENGTEYSKFYKNASTIAGGIRVPKALGDFLVLRAIRETNGTAIQVKDSEILESLDLIAKTEGLFICPEGATLVAALSKLIDNGFIKQNEKVVLLNTGTGIKYPSLIDFDLPILKINESI